MNRPPTFLILFAAFALSIVGLPVVAAQGECAEVDVQLDGDACGRTVSASLLGDATSEPGCRDAAVGFVKCVSVSGAGDASNDGACQGVAACIAISGTGNSSNAAEGYGCGHMATPYHELPSTGCFAVSATGNASNSAQGGCGKALSVLAAGCVAVSGLGSASNEAGADACGQGRSLAVGVGCVAVGWDSARNTRQGESCEPEFLENQMLGARCIALVVGR